MDGVIVAISSVTYPVGFYPFGAVKSYTKVGGIIFVDDNGDAELAQPLGLQNNVITPKAILKPSSAILRVTSGVVGTITPWTSP